MVLYTLIELGATIEVVYSDLAGVIEKHETCSKTTVKPVVRLTYDEPVKARDQSITVVEALPKRLERAR